MNSTGEYVFTVNDGCLIGWNALGSAAKAYTSCLSEKFGEGGEENVVKIAKEG